MNDTEKRKRLKAYWAEVDRVQALREKMQAAHHRRVMRDWSPLRGPLPVLTLPALPPYPDGLHGMSCGARTRAGTPCKRTDLHTNGRCKLHGGMSTGPRTKAGKARAALNGNVPKRTP
jgi:hypothetical protein